LASNRKKKKGNGVERVHCPKRGKKKSKKKIRVAVQSIGNTGKKTLTGLKNNSSIWLANRGKEWRKQEKKNKTGRGNGGAEQ